MGVSVAINPVSLSTPATSALGPSTSSRRVDSSNSCRRKATPAASIPRKRSIRLMQNRPLGRSVLGMNSTLKTGLGKALAEAMRYYYFDSDDLVVQASGGSANARAFLETDEAGFRESETEVLKQLSSMGRLVVCCGDGAVRSSTNLAFLRHGISVWIDLPLDLLADEVINGKTEYPLARAIPSSSSIDEVLDGIAEHYRENKEGYAIADATISLLKVAAQLGYSDFGSVAPGDMALEVLNQIEKLTRIKKMMEEAAKPF